MLEIVALLIFCGALTPVIKNKNRNKWLILLAPALWYAGKFIAVFVSGIVCAVLETAPDDNEMIIYGSSLLGGILGCVVAYLLNPQTIPLIICFYVTIALFVIRLWIAALNRISCSPISDGIKFCWVLLVIFTPVIGSTAALFVIKE